MTNSEIPYYPFDPKTAKTIVLEDVECFKYLPESVYLQTVARLASEIDPENSIIVYNLKGAQMVALDILKSWQEAGKDLSQTLLFSIECKSSDSNQTSGHVRWVKEFDNGFVKERKVIVIEDIGDSNGVITAIVQAAHQAGASTVETAVLTRKVNRPGQLAHQYDYVGVNIDNVWVGGWGMDFGTPDVKPDFPRSSKILVVKK